MFVTRRYIEVPAGRRAPRRRQCLARCPRVRPEVDRDDRFEGMRTVTGREIEEPMTGRDRLDVVDQAIVARRVVRVGAHTPPFAVVVVEHEPVGGLGDAHQRGGLVGSLDEARVLGDAAAGVRPPRRRRSAPRLWDVAAGTGVPGRPCRRPRAPTRDRDGAPRRRHRCGRRRRPPGPHPSRRRRG